MSTQMATETEYTGREKGKPTALGSMSFVNHATSMPLYLQNNRLKTCLLEFALLMGHLAMLTSKTFSLIARAKDIPS